MVRSNHFIELGAYTAGSAACIQRVDLRRHLYLIGKTGTGRSTLLHNLLQSEIAAGGGVALLDPHGDLTEAIADSIPSCRVNDVIYFDPSDLAYPIGFNPLHNVALEQRPLVAAQIVASFRHIWADPWGPRLEYVLTYAIRLLLDAPGSTLLGLSKLLVDDAFRAQLVCSCCDPLVKNYWTFEFDSYPERLKAEVISPLQNKIGTLLASPALRNILGQPKSTLDICRVMDDGQVLIVNLSKGKLGEGPTNLLGALVTTAFAQAAETRANQLEDERRDFQLVADEFQNFATESFSAILSEARKYRLSLVLAHQFLGQLPPLLRQAVTGNAGSMIAFRIGSEDAALIADEVGLQSPSALTELPNFATWARLMSNGLPLEPRRIETLEPFGDRVERLDAVRHRTRARYARPRQVVENRINRFLEH